MKQFIKIALLGIFFVGVSSVDAQTLFVSPYQVENVTATPSGSSVRLKWDEAMDQDYGIVVGYNIYYGTESVTAENGNDYPHEIPIYTQDTEYTIGNLSPGTYYFAVVARDDEQNLSDRYSVEVSATIKGATGSGSSSDSGFPRVMQVSQVGPGTIQVEMSEPIQIESLLDGFFIQHKETLDDILVQRVDIESQFVFLTVSESALIEGETYEVVATAFVEDLDGNPVASGITDTGNFRAQLMDFPTMTESEPEPLDELFVTEEPIEEFFEEPVRETASDPFLNVATAEPTPDPVYVGDTTAPYDVTSLKVDDDTLFTDFYVTISWEKSLNIDNDVVDQVLYSRVDGADWDNGYSLGPDLEVIELDVDLNRTYEVKIVTVDNSGNESSGSMIQFTTDVPLTNSGSESYIFGLIGIICVGMGGFMVARKRNRLY